MEVTVRHLSATQVEARVRGLRGALQSRFMVFSGGSIAVFPFENAFSTQQTAKLHAVIT
jgi:hypothetical protein